MSTSSWKVLASSMKKVCNGKEKSEPTDHQLSRIKESLGELTMLLARLEYERNVSSESESESESESDESSESDSDEDCDGDCASSSGSTKRSYTKGPRAMGYRLFIEHGGSRAQWGEKSEKYKDRIYERNS